MSAAANTVLESYKLGKVLGSGISGIVFLATKNTGEKYAIKIQCLEKGKKERKIHLAITSLLKNSPTLANFVALKDFQVIDEKTLLEYLPSDTFEDPDASRILLECKDKQLLILVIDLIEVDLLNFIKHDYAHNLGLASAIPIQCMFEIYYGILSMLSYNIVPGDIHVENIAFITLSESLCYKLCNRYVCIDAGSPHVQFIDYGLYRIASKGVSVDKVLHKLIMSITEDLFDQLEKILQDDEESMQYIKFFLNPDLLDQPAFNVLVKYADTFLSNDIHDVKGKTVSISGTVELCKLLDVYADK